MNHPLHGSVVEVSGIRYAVFWKVGIAVKFLWKLQGRRAVCGAWIREVGLACLTHWFIHSSCVTAENCGEFKTGSRNVTGIFPFLQWSIDAAFNISVHRKFMDSITAELLWKLRGGRWAGWISTLGFCLCMLWFFHSFLLKSQSVFIYCRIG